MNHDRYDDAYLREVLNAARTVAVVGASPRPERPSHYVARFLADTGRRVFAINPGQAGKDIAGLPTYASLAEVPEPVDMVDVFRASQHAPAVVAEALKMQPRPAVIWMQLGVRNDAAAAIHRLPGRSIRQISHAGDPVAGNADIATTPRLARAVDNFAAR